MVKAIAGILLLTLSGLAIMIYLVGSHGHLMFRPHMKEDWIIWGIAIISFVAGFYLLWKSRSKHPSRNILD